MSSSPAAVRDILTGAGVEATSTAGGQPLSKSIERFQGRVLIVAPHMDDEVLACGGLMALLSDKSRIYVAYATDGTMSPAPVLPGSDAASPDLGELRMQESVQAMAVLGVPEANLSFIGLPEARLPSHAEELARRIQALLERIQPDHVLVPFRLDRHPDHLAVNQVVTNALQEGRLRGELTEYFVYHRWRLLPKRDIRRYLRHPQLIRVDLSSVAAMKRRALDCFRTQTTRYYPWQTRPILTPELLDEECREEQFLCYDPDYPGMKVVTSMSAWIRVAHRLEPRLQKLKYLATTAAQRATGRA